MGTKVSKRRGFTIVEMMITLMLFGILSTVSFVAIREASVIWRKTSSRDAVSKSLGRAWSSLRRDLENIKLDTQSFATQKVSPSLGSGNDGDALCFLSPEDANGDLAVDDLGNAFMVNNIVYYLIVPQNHDQMFGMHCNGGADSAGYEMQCPHKALVRVTQDNNPSGGPADPTDNKTKNVLIPTWNTLFTRPTNLQGGTATRKVVAANLLTFRLNPDTTNNMLRVEMSAVASEDAARNIPLGSVQLGATPYTTAQRTSFVCRN